MTKSKLNTQRSNLKKILLTQASSQIDEFLDKAVLSPDNRSEEYVDELLVSIRLTLSDGGSATKYSDPVDVTQLMETGARVPYSAVYDLIASRTHELITRAQKQHKEIVR